MSTSNDASDAKATARPFTIAVGLAFTDADGPAFDQAARLALRAVRSELHLVHVYEHEPSPERSRELVDHLRLYVNEKAAITHGLRGVTVGIHIRTGKAVREIVQLATEVHADLIVVGAQHGPHLKQWVVGSTSAHLLASAPCPVLVASPPPREPVHHEPTIEPPCPECVRARLASGGAAWWCARHSEYASGSHAYSYQRDVPFASHDSSVIPTGIEF